jgi:hypothetical protein
MTKDQIKEAVATIRRVEKAMIAEMTDAEYDAYMAISEEMRKRMLYEAYMVTRH